MIQNEKKFDLTVTIKKPSSSITKELAFDVILYLENQAQYLYIESEQGGDLFNIPLYKDGYELSAITTWACNYWTGKNGSYKLVGITLNGKENN